MNRSPTTATGAAYTLTQLLSYLLRLGTLGFGGSVALVGSMHRDLVEQRKWFGEDDYNEGFALAQLAPGPLATQLAIYLGHVHYGISGATLAGLAFVMPSFLMVTGLGWAYARFGGLPWIQSVFYGVGAAVIGIVAMSVKRLTEKSVGDDRLLWAIYLLSAVATAATASDPGWLLIVAGLVTWIVRAPPKRFSASRLNAFAFAQLPMLAQLAASTETSVLAQIAIFFTKVGAFAVGSGLTIVPFLYDGTVVDHRWLTEKQFVDAVAVAMITPGPVAITVGFIGYLADGLAGACAAALGTFMPCYLFTVIAAPYFKRYGKAPGVAAFADGITAAAIGATAGAVVTLAKLSITDMPTACIALITAALLWRFDRLREPVVVAGAAVLGLIIYPLVHG
jgi:chromate transporter